MADVKSPSSNPIAWIEGMFMRQQHMQQHDLYVETRLRDQMRSLDPFHWGVRTLEVNQEALSEHRVEILRLEAILPGGVALSYPGNCSLQAREFDPTVNSLDVWCGIKRISPIESSSAADESGPRDVRYHIYTSEVPDIHRGGVESPVEFLRPNVRLLVSGEEVELEQYDCFKLARVVATGELKRPFALAPNYAPPLLSVQASPILDDEIQKVLSQISARIRVVAGRTSTIAIADMPRLWMRYTLARMTPLLRHLMSTGATHPFELYSALVETAGALGAFTLSEPAELPRYDHENLYFCFHDCLKFIEGELEGALPDRFKELEMRFDGQCYATSGINLELSEPRNHFFLGVKAEYDAEQLGRLMKEEGKCASRGELVDSLLFLNLKGLRIEALPAAPTEIAARVGYQYWQVDPHSNSKMWRRVRDDGTMGLHLGKLHQAEVRLYVVAAES